MTVMVTGASGLLGRAIVAELALRDEVRATVRREEAAGELRDLGAKVAVRPVESADELIEILPRVHTLVHLIGGVNQPSDETILEANHASTLAVVAAAKEARVPRLVLLSVPGADPRHPHPFLRAKGLAEEAVTNSGLEHAVLRSAPAYGLGGLWFTATVVGAEHGFVIGPGDRSLAPIAAEDVARVIAAIDDRRDQVEGTWSLRGPDEVTADELFDLLDGEGDPRHLEPVDAADVLSDLLGVPVSFRAAEHFAGSTGGPAIDGGGIDASDAFGVRPISLADGLRRTADRAGAAARVRDDA